MIGPLFESYDSTHLERLINILIESGIKVKSDAKAYRFRRGLGLVQGVIGFGNSENSIYLVSIRETIKINDINDLGEVKRNEE